MSFKEKLLVAIFLLIPYKSIADTYLTCYTGQNYTGASSIDYGTGNTDGYMNTLSDAQLKNKIRSFKLKKGYMVTFAVGEAGWGYSRCFIAADGDLNMSQLPAVLDGKISSYRIFKWMDVRKNGLANDIDATTNNALKTYNIVGTGVSDFNQYQVYLQVDDNMMTIGVRSDGKWFKIANIKLEYICSKDNASDEIKREVTRGRALQQWFFPWKGGNPNGDVNLDMKTNVTDLTTLIDYLKTNKEDYGTADQNNDAKLNIDDLNVLLQKLIGK